MFPRVLTEDTAVGSGAGATDGDTVYVEYIGKLARDGTQFDTNVPELSEKNKNPLVFTIGPNGTVIPGMMAGVKGMKVGGKRTVKIPFSSGYGAAGSEGIPPYADLVFDLKLLYIVKKGEENDVTVKDVTVGTGAELHANDIAEVNYIGRFVNNRAFDSTYDRKKTVTFQLGRGKVISGFDKGIEGMRVGGKRVLTINPASGWGVYGKGVVPANAVLVYEIELVSVKPGTN